MFDDFDLAPSKGKSKTPSFKFKFDLDNRLQEKAKHKQASKQSRHRKQTVVYTGKNDDE